MKLKKIIYQYDLELDKIHARHCYDDGSDSVQHHTRQEWLDLEADIKANQPEVVLRPAAEELLP